jgi:hypothetical protein
MKSILNRNYYHSLKQANSLAWYSLWIKLDES